MNKINAIALNRKIIQLLTIAGIILTIYLGYIIAKHHYFEVGGAFHQLVGHWGIYGVLFFILIQIQYAQQHKLIRPELSNKRLVQFG